MLNAPAYEAALAYLYGRINYERTSAPPYLSQTLSLERMRELLHRLGNPQDELQIVHVAGTKGKGSTAAMIASILQQSGRCVGLYTSPHFERLEERFVINGCLCSEVEFADLIEGIRPAVATMDADAARNDSFGPTFFEITTAVGLAYFARRRVDVAVVEVGMGGRLDSTNVCQPLVSVITSISLDHTKQLGNTLAKIAREKAGIIKPGVPVVSGVEAAEPRSVIESISRERDARLSQLGRDFRVEYEPASTSGQPSVHYEDGTTRLSDLQPSLLGRHQACNAGVAVATIQQLRAAGWRIDEHAIREGLTRTVCPGRIEVISRDPTVILDTGHNLASIEALTIALAESFRPARRHLIFATTKEKDVSGMLARLLPKFDEAWLTQYVTNPRALDVTSLQQAAATVMSSLPESARPRVHIETSPHLTLDHCRAAAKPEDLICVTGSFFLAAELRPQLTAQAPHSVALG